MTKETPELLAECWQLLVEYIPRRDHIASAEKLISYLESVLDKDELQAVSDLDPDLEDAYRSVIDIEEDEVDEDEEEDY